MNAQKVQILALYLDYARMGGPEGIDAENAYWAAEAANQKYELEQQRQSEYYLYENDPYVRDCTDREEALFGPFDPWGDLS